MDDNLFMLANTCPEYSYTEAGVCVTDKIMDHWGQTAHTFLDVMTIEVCGSGTHAELREGLQDHLATIIGTERADKAMTHVANHLDLWS